MFGLFSSTFGGVVSRDNTQPQSNGNVVSTFTVPVAVNQITDDELTCPVCTFNVKESGMFDTGDEVRLVKLAFCGHVCHAECVKEMAKNTKTYIQVSREKDGSSVNN